MSRKKLLGFLQYSLVIIPIALFVVIVFKYLALHTGREKPPQIPNETSSPNSKPAQDDSTITPTPQANGLHKPSVPSSPVATDDSEQQPVKKELTADDMLTIASQAVGAFKRRNINQFGNIKSSLVSEGKDILPLIREALKKETDIQKKCFLIDVFGQIGETEVVGELVETLKSDENISVKRSVIHSLGKIYSKSATAPAEIITLLKEFFSSHSDQSMRREAQKALKMINK